MLLPVNFKLCFTSDEIDKLQKIKLKNTNP